MTIFKSQQVNLDPAPYTCPSFPSVRHTHGEKRCGGSVYAPRPEFEPTRDPEPWLCRACSIGGGPRYATRAEADHTGAAEWAPRREQFDTPVNRVLAEFRVAWDDDNREDARYELTLRWFEALGNTASWRNPCEYTTDEIDHARRVMARLWGWKEQANG